MFLITEWKIHFFYICNRDTTLGKAEKKTIYFIRKIETCIGSPDDALVEQNILHRVFTLYFIKQLPSESPQKYCP